MPEVFGVKIVQDFSIDRFEKILNCLPCDRVMKIKKFRKYEDSLRTLTAEVLIRTIACTRLKKDNESIKFETGKHGKPYIPNQDDFHFNLSHSGDWVVCAVSHRPVGIDVEKIKEVDFAIANRFFSAQEARDLFLKEGEERKDYFFNLWTLKESYIKADGRGLSLPLNSFSFKIEKSKILFTTDNDLKDCFFKIYDIDNEYKVSVCSLENEYPKNITLKKFDDLLDEFLLK